MPGAHAVHAAQASVMEYSAPGVDCIAPALDAAPIDDIVSGPAVSQGALAPVDACLHGTLHLHLSAGYISPAPVGTQHQP